MWEADQLYSLTEFTLLSEGSMEDEDDADAYSLGGLREPWLSEYIVPSEALSLPLSLTLL